MISFYNFATGTLLNELSTLIKSSNGSSTWRPLITYKNILRAIENIGTEMSLGLRLLLKYQNQTFSLESKLANLRFIGRGELSGKNYVRLVEQHKLSKEYMMQAETFASNLRENLDKVRNSEDFKTFTLSLSSPGETVQGFQNLQLNLPVPQCSHKCYLRDEVQIFQISFQLYPLYPFPSCRSELLDSLFNYFTETVNVMNQMRGIITEIRMEIQVFSRL